MQPGTRRIVGRFTSMQIIYLIRHGETEHNRTGRIQGHIESDLSDLGIEQARRLGPRLARLDIVAAYASTLRRAADTARIALGERMAATLRDDLREIGLGEWEGREAATLRDDYPEEVRLWFEAPSRVRIPGAETMDAFRARVVRGFSAIREAHPDGTVMVFTHGGVICAWLTSVLGMKLDDIWRFKIRNASLTRVLFPHGRPRIDMLGDVSHLGDAVSEPQPPRRRMLP